MSEERWHPLKISYARWVEAGEERYGIDIWSWRFTCPSCGSIITTQDYKDAGAGEGSVAFSCVGRWTGAERKAFSEGKGPCEYTGGGLFRINPLLITFDDGRERESFDFADRPLNTLAVKVGV